MTDTRFLPTNLCPLCLEPPSIVVDNGHQAWCGTPNCEVVMWDMHRYADDRLAPVKLDRDSVPEPVER
jgi:hypothetical protein